MTVFAYELPEEGGGSFEGEKVVRRHVWKDLVFLKFHGQLVELLEDSNRLVWNITVHYLLKLTVFVEVEIVVIDAIADE